jgi:hypothetical protein
MNTNLLKAAIPFAVIADAALMVKGFAGYSDPTLTVVAVASAVVCVLMILRATGYLNMPTFTPSRSSQEDESAYDRGYRHGHSAGNAVEHDCEDEDGDEDNAYDRGYQDGKDEVDDTSNYDEGHTDGHDAGYDAGYEARKSEERAEAEEMARYIVSALKADKEVAPVAETPTATPTETSTLQHDGNA